jgi:hypothetical protein
MHRQHTTRIALTAKHLYITNMPHPNDSQHLWLMLRQPMVGMATTGGTGRSGRPIRMHSIHKAASQDEK